ncbi:unnamed protein product [Psylliodes chrysocephalus]|uniref:Carboxylic ester hydrolase n=1 Tax=Psylliodes chrysocephalus TaxID=3402493 RepID=A0A9P0G972_9CUCU|nr:unnamed protein product [Psylliodes chrysocephala]
MIFINISRTKLTGKQLTSFLKMTEHLVVSTENGKIKGKVGKDYHGGKFYSFSGIPYAKAPVGELRFKAPEPADPWEGVRDGTKEGPECPQMFLRPKFYVGKQDNCLNLNVYTKELPKTDDTKKKPVMVFIHGGGFIFGSNKKNFFGPQYLLTEDIVLVIPNYRLGVLGFLSLEDTSLNVPGNAGLKDQVMALKWVQKNIHHFGGDVNNVTIFGQSAGSASVHYLTLSKLTKGLFHKAIMQSGSAFNPWARGKRNAADIAKVMGYQPNIDEKTILQKLRQASTKSIVKAQNKVVDNTFTSVVRPFGPVIEYKHDEAFLDEDPVEIIKAGKNQQIPVIIGYTSLEGLLYEVIRKVRSDAKLPGSLEVDIPYELNISEKSETAKKIAEEMKQFYYNDKDLSKKNINIRFMLSSDILFLHGIQRTINLLKKYSTTPVYAYKMTVSSPLNFLTMCCQSNYFLTVGMYNLFIRWSGQSSLKHLFQNLRKKLLVKHLDGVAHGDDLFYLMSTSLSPKVAIGSEEDIYIQRFVKLWTNFAKHGDPTPEALEVLNSTKWSPVVDEPISSILEIGNTIKMTEYTENERLKFWDKLYEDYAS